MGGKVAFSTLNILLFADYGETGGTRTYFKQLLSLYAEKNASVTVVRTYEEQDSEIDSLCCQYGFRCVNLSSIVDANKILQGKPVIRFFLERYLLKNFVKISAADIVVASVGSPELFLAALCWANRSIYILHTYPHVTKHFLKRFIRKLFFSIFVSTGMNILTVSKYSRSCILRGWGLWGNKNAVKVIYNTAGKDVLTEPLRRGSTINILTVGHTVTYKNPDTWINVAILLRKNSPDLDIKFKWVGDGSRLSECRDKVKSLGAESYISFVGRDNNVAEHYSQCDIYVQPSHIESLGLSVLDAMRHGKPCVVANTGGLPEVVCNGKSGWVVEADNVEEMARRIEMLARNKQLRETFGRSSKEIYNKLFGIDQWAKDIWALHNIR
jgi:glycosyltransferase involved in cell wall biosynthesis